MASISIFQRGAWLGRAMRDVTSRHARSKSFSLALEVGDARDSVLEVLHHFRKKEAEGAEADLLVRAAGQSREKSMRKTHREVDDDVR